MRLRIGELRIGAAGLKLQKNITRLPKEVIAHIFALSGSGLALSQVSKAFRNLALDTPRLWSKLSSDIPLPLARAYLERSKDAALTVHITSRHARCPYRDDNPVPCQCLAPFIDLIHSQRKRWAAVHVDGYTRTLQEALSAVSPHLKPDLPIISATFDPSVDTKVSTSIWQQEGPESLLGISISQAMPVPEVLGRLSVCKIGCNQPAAKRAGFYRDLNYSLFSMTALTEFSFRLRGHFVADDSDDTSPSSLKDIFLPRLSKLVLKLSGNSMGVQWALTALLKRLSFPRLESMELQITQPSLDEPVATWEAHDCESQGHPAQGSNPINHEGNGDDRGGSGNVDHNDHNGLHLFYSAACPSCGFPYRSDPEHTENIAILPFVLDHSKFSTLRYFSFNSSGDAFSMPQTLPYILNRVPQLKELSVELARSGKGWDWVSEKHPEEWVAAPWCELEIFTY